MTAEFEGALLAVIAERAGAAAAVLECFGGAVGEAARRRMAELRALPAAARAKEVAAVLARAGSPVPPALRAVHGDWVMATLEAEPEAKAAMAAAAMPAAAVELSPGAVWMLRRAFGAFPLTAMAADEVAAARAALARRGAQALHAVLGGMGGEGGKRAAVAAALAQLGESGEVLKAVVREREASAGSAGSGRAEATGDGGALAAATRACRGVELRSPYALERIGAAAMGKELEAMQGEERERWRELRWFLPRSVGMALAAHLG